MVEIQTSQVMSKVKLKETNKPGEVTGRKVNAHANGKQFLINKSTNIFKTYMTSAMENYQ